MIPESLFEGMGRSAPDGSDLCVPRYHQRKHDVRSLSFNCPITIPYRILQGFSRATRVFS
jgi:hypothetical protein